MFFQIVPAGCEDYKLLTNPKRKTSYNTPSGPAKCDQSGDIDVSPDWQGPGWYRISPSIGTKIPTSPTKYKHCGTFVTGWISNGGSTPGLGQTINAKACFVLNDGNNCDENVDIQIRNCKDYLLYYLPNVPDCRLGYCVE